MTSKKKNNQDVTVVHQSEGDQALWKQFVVTCAAHIDPVLASILHSTDLVTFDRNKQVLEVVTYKKFMFFQDLFIEQKTVYQKYLNQLFGYQVMLMIQFSKADQLHVVVKNQPTAAQQVDSIQSAHLDMTGSAKNRPQEMVVKTGQARSSYEIPKTGTKEYSKKTYSRSTAPQEFAANEKSLDVSDKQKWKITNQLLQHFGGSVKEIIKDTHEFDA